MEVNKNKKILFEFFINASNNVKNEQLKKFPIQIFSISSLLYVCTVGKTSQNFYFIYFIVSHMDKFNEQKISSLNTIN